MTKLIFYTYSSRNYTYKYKYNWNFPTEPFLALIFKHKWWLQNYMLLFWMIFLQSKRGRKKWSSWKKYLTNGKKIGTNKVSLHLPYRKNDVILFFFKVITRWTFFRFLHTINCVIYGTVVCHLRNISQLQQQTKNRVLSWLDALSGIVSTSFLVARTS